MICQQRLKEVLEYDPNTGIFTWIVKPSSRVSAGDIAGRVCNDGYVGIRINRIRYPAHRLVWLYAYGAWPKYQIDHINGNKIDNRISNLRDVTIRENGQNLKVHRDGRLCGACLNRKTGRWESRIKILGRKIHLGTFHTEKEAHDSYRLACLHEEMRNA